MHIFLNCEEIILIKNILFFLTGILYNKSNRNARCESFRNISWEFYCFPGNQFPLFPAKIPPSPYLTFGGRVDWDGMVYQLPELSWAGFNL